LTDHFKNLVLKVFGYVCTPTFIHEITVQNWKEYSERLHAVKSQHV